MASSPLAQYAAGVLNQNELETRQRVAAARKLGENRFPLLVDSVEASGVAASFDLDSRID